MQARNRIYCEVVQIDAPAKDVRYTKERDYLMESDRPRTNPDEQCCSDALVTSGLTLRQPL